MLAALERQGTLWLAFIRAAHRLYIESHQGGAPRWIAGWLDAGKPPRLVEFGRMNRFKAAVPLVLRPDLLLTPGGLAACELDAVPGGIGLLGCLSRLYELEGFSLAGGPDGMVAGFREALGWMAGMPDPVTAIVVSEESSMYRPEMQWLAGALAAAGGSVTAVDPAGVAAGDSGVRLAANGRALDAVYRFFELFDLDQVPGGEALLEAAKMKQVRLTPPPKAHLEEKIWFALLHHPVLAPHWEGLLGVAAYEELRALVIPTWVLDPTPLPGHAVIAGQPVAGRTLQSWDDLAGLSQRERSLVLKPSGFGEDAWGSHGVRFGSDLSQPDWAAAVRQALEAFPTRPWILQPYRPAAVIDAPYWDPGRGEIHAMAGRVRLCPYYFVTGETETRLGGVLATVCPADKKAIHGMPEAIMAPCGPVRE